MSSGRMIRAFCALISRSGPLTAASQFVQHFSRLTDCFRQIPQREKSKMILHGGSPLWSTTCQSKILPWAQNSLRAHFVPRNLVGECLPQTLLGVVASSTSLASPHAAKLVRSAAPPLPIANAALVCAGGPIAACCSFFKFACSKRRSFCPCRKSTTRPIEA